MYIDDIKTYVSTKPNSEPFRNKNGGNIFFRPVALIPIVKAIIKIAMRTDVGFETIIKKANTLPLYLDNSCWQGILWDNNNKKMIMNNKTTTEWLFMLMYDRNILSEKELERLYKGFASARQISITDAKERLSDF